MKPLLAAAFRQALLGLLLTGVSLPPILALSRHLGLAAPPTDGLLLLGGSVLLACAVGGILGVLLGRAGRPRFAAPLLGFVGGLFLCGLTFPAYLDTVFDALTEHGSEIAADRAGRILERPSAAIDQAIEAAGTLTQEGIAYAPPLLLLGWTLFGPVFSANWERRKSGR